MLKRKMHSRRVLLQILLLVLLLNGQIPSHKGNKEKIIENKEKLIDESGKIKVVD